ncbi:MAG: hypothetical protein LAO08_20105 [Acidobacteriia bacterium]|nr:hypothetical protein [Terriglobia bacterium]
MTSKKKEKVMCYCCGTFSTAELCVQCRFAGCGLNKIGQQCRLAAVGRQVSHSIAPPDTNKLEVLR